MKKSVLIAIVAAVLVVGGAAAFFLTREDSSTNNNETGTQDTTPAENGAADTSQEFAPLSTEGRDFSATITVNGDTSGTFEQDGDKTRFASTVDGQRGEFIYTPDATYSCTEGECFKFPNDSDAADGFDTDDYEFSESDLEKLRTDAKYEGRKDCPAGTCDVWTVTDEGTTSSVYIDTKTRLISQVEGTYDGDVTKIVFEYRDVIIEVPANAQEFPGL